MSKTDFTVPRRMGLSAFFIIFIKILKSLLGAAVIMISFKIFETDFSFSDKSLWLRALGAFVGVSAVSLILAFAAYFPKKFYLQGGSLIFSHGIFRREKTCIPLDRVHSLRTRRELWYRILGLRGIVFDTLATKGEEIELILSEKDWQRLMFLLEKEECPQQSSAIAPPDYDSSRTVSFDNEALVLDALCQNHLKGMAVLGSFLALVYSNVSDYAATETISDYTVSYFDSLLVSPLRIFAFLGVVYLLVLTLWLGKVLLRYFNTSLTSDKTLLSFNYGMISRFSSRFSFDKICTVWIKRNIFEKNLGLCTLMLRQALNVTANKEEDNLKLYGRDRSAFFLSWWLGDSYADAPEIITARSGRGAFVHSFLPDLFISAVAVVGLVHLELLAWIIFPLIYAVVSLFKGYCAMRRSRIILTDSYFKICNGRFAEIENYVKYSNLEVVRLRRTLLSRWFHRANLHIATAGTNFAVRSLKEDEACLIYEFLLYKTENNGHSDIERT